MLFVKLELHWLFSFLPFSSQAYIGAHVATRKVWFMYEKEKEKRLMLRE
jgi:hypothetical protein